MRGSVKHRDSEEDIAARAVVTGFSDASMATI